MQLQQASRKKAKIKMALQGPAGSGKTYSSLLIAYGLCGNWSKIAVIDTENHSADLYAHLGTYFVFSLEPPFSPEKYIEAIRLCVSGGMQVLIIDSISHEWEGAGGILNVHGGMTGNSFTNWSKLTPRHNAFVQEILQSPLHVIATIRTKHDYVLTEKNGKIIPEKVGLKGVSRENIEYEFTLVLNIDIKHQVLATKDRTSLFIDKPEFMITTQTGRQLLDWCNTGIQMAQPIKDRINECKSLSELLDLYKISSPTDQAHLQEQFSVRKKALEHDQKSNLNNSKISANGTNI